MRTLERSLAVVLAMLIGVAGSALAQMVSGTVVDDRAQQPIEGAEVVLTRDGSAQSPRTLTDTTGRFTLRVPRAGVYTLHVRHPSFLPFEATSLNLGTGEVMSLEVRLGVETIPLEPIRVTARRAPTGLAGFDQRRRAGFGQYMTRDEIRLHAGGRVTDLLRNMSGLTFRPAPDSRAGSIALMSGGATGRCLPMVWIDDVQVEQHENSTLDQVLTPSTIEAVEVYTSHAAAPPQYVSGLCGVIVFWTRQGGEEGASRFDWKKVVGGAAASGLLIFLLLR